MSTELVISGPTGSGKSSLALSLARELNGELINADSVQCYKDHYIGAATPLEDDRKEVPHHLYLFHPGGKKYDVKQYTDDLRKTLQEVRSKNKQPIVVGGSTLYLRSWLQGLSDLPKTPPELRENYEQKTTEELYKELQEKDRNRADELHPNDRQRIMRALEVVTLTGEPVSKMYEELPKNSHGVPALILVPQWGREELYQRINQRAKEMVAGGLIEETETLQQQFGEEWQCKKALGYAEVTRYLAGELTIEELPTEIAQSTRRYAKRQLTFWRNDPKKVGWRVENVSLTLKALLERVRVTLEAGLQENEVWYCDAGELWH